MTDTPRTIDELLTSFANNTSRAISPQKMRDFVVSAMLEPVDYEVMTYQSDQQAIVENTVVPCEFDNLRDPQGWAGDDDLESDYIFGSPTFGAGSWFTLPKGQYYWYARGFWESKPSAGFGAIELLPIVLAEVLLDDVWGFWGNSPSYSQKNTAFPQRRGSVEEAGGSFRVSLDSMRFGLMAEHVSTSAGTLNLQGAGFHIARIS